MTIIETPIFSRRLNDIMTDEEYRELQNVLIVRPDAGKIIPGGGGVRKLRWIGSGRGKRGGSRIIYFWFPAKEIILMLYIYTKKESEDLTSEQLKIMKKIVGLEFK